MVIDIFLVLGASVAVFAGYQRGLLRSLLTTAGYIGGGVLGLILALQFVENMHTNLNRFIAVFVAIFLMAELGRRFAKWLAKYFRTKIMWGPLRFIDSLLGVALELVRLAVISYLLISVLLWSPWQDARNQVADSMIYHKIVEYEPIYLDRLREEIDQKLSISLQK